MTSSTTQTPGRPEPDPEPIFSGYYDAQFLDRAERPGAAGRVSSPSGSIFYANVEGTLSEMARQLGEKTGRLASRGPVPGYATFLAETLRDSPFARFADLLQWGTSRWATDRLVDACDPEYRRAAREYAESLPLSTRSLLEVYTLPESLLWLAGTVHQFLGADRMAGLGRPPFGGCTSVVVRPPLAPTPLHGRNFDWYGFGSWERTACIQFYHPDSGLDYASVGTAGLFGGGYTAMNAAGLTLAVHQHFVDDFDFDGVPVGIAGDRVMRRARNIDEAVDILRHNPPVAGWSYVLTEGDTGACSVVELAPGREAVLDLSEHRDRLAYANTYRSETFDETEIDLYPEYRRDSIARETRALEQTGALSASGADPETLAELLGDFVDPTEDTTRLVGRSIASVHTVSSVVFEPERRRIWVGSGNSPTSRSWFVPFRLRRSGRSDRGGPDPSAEPFHPTLGWDRSSHGRAFELYRRAAVESFEGEEDKRLLIRIEHALALYPEDPALHMLGGLLALRLGRARRAEGAFRRTLERVRHLTRRAEATLYLGWALDLQGQRSAARQMYRDVLRMESADPVVRARARLGRWLRFSRERAAGLAIDFVHVGVF